MAESAAVRVPLLAEAAAENVALSVAVAELLGLTKEEILSGVAKMQPIEHRLQLLEKDGVYILDDAYNCNEKGAKIAIDALCRFAGKKIIVTPGIVETGVLHEQVNGHLGELLAAAGLDQVFIVGETQIKVLVDAYKNAGGDERALKVVPSLQDAVKALQGQLSAGDCVLFMNDLPDVV
jgi:UDP-N-acetylmuramoyl-tripeptide--D-alanyl-D-alanine ligase